MHTEMGAPNSDLTIFGQLEFPSGNVEMTFQVDIVLSESPLEVWFGILNFPFHSKSQVKGFAVRIDFARCEVWDSVNGAGLLGLIEMPPTASEDRDQSDSFLLSLKLEKRGINLLPLLEVGGKTYLYPALSLVNLENHRMTAVAGTIQTGRDAEPFCHFPAFWIIDSNS